MRELCWQTKPTFASSTQDGAEALQKMSESLPDVVLTDMIMPNMGGLELVSQIGKKYPTVPTILMTSVGNEESAVRALHRARPATCPNCALVGNLVDTVRNVLEVGRKERGHSRLMDYMKHNELEFELDNDRNLIAPLVGHLQEGVARLKICGEADQMAHRHCAGRGAGQCGVPWQSGAEFGAA